MSTINSTTLSSNDKISRELELFTGFLEGQYSLSKIQEALREELTIDFSRGQEHREIHTTGLGLDGTAKIPVKESHLRHMLQQYIIGAVSETDLSDWAAFILAFVGIYVPEGDTEEARDEAGDRSMWDILQRLVTPSLFDGLDSAVAQRYLRMLE